MSQPGDEQASKRSTFGRLGFIIAASGSAVGLGNIWKFPYIAYANDGGSFVLIYLLAVLIIGIPIMLAEILIGRRVKRSPVGAVLQLAKNAVGGKAWSVIGWLGIVAGFVIFSYYSVVAGWTVFYFGKCLSWSFGGFSADNAAAVGTEFSQFLGNGTLQIAFHFIFVVATAGVVIFGIKAGIERTTKVLMPILLVILVVLVINSIFSPGFGEAISFLFHIGPIDADGILEAVGHSFFTLSLGMGAMITYGSYVSKKDSIPKSGLTVSILDTMIAIMACIVMFSIIFAVPEAERGESFSKSSTILFTTLPRMFYSMPAGAYLSPVFYLLVGFAALSSTISLLEVVVTYFIDEKGWNRKKATLIVASLVFATGVPAALSMGSSEFLSNLQPFGETTKGVFDTLDYLASNWLLPVGGLLIALFVGWILSNKLTQEELDEGHGKFKMHTLWKFALRFVCPIAIGWIIYAVISGRTFH